MPGQLLAQDLAEPLLVRRVQVRVQQADGDRLDVGLAQPRGERAAPRPRRARCSTSPSARHPLGDLEAEAPRDERRRLRPEVVVEVRHAHPPQLEHVAEALGRDERRPRAAALEHGVRGDGRPVHDALDRVAPSPASSRDGVDDRAVVGRRRREHLREAQPPPSASSSSTSVNVPPTSAPIRARAHRPGPSCSDGSDGQIRSTAPRMLSWITRSASSGSRRSHASKNVVVVGDRAPEALGAREHEVVVALGAPEEPLDLGDEPRAAGGVVADGVEVPAELRGSCRRPAASRAGRARRASRASARPRPAPIAATPTRAARPSSPSRAA